MEQVSGYLPKILKIDASGMPQQWISIEDAISYYCTDMVLYELGSPVVTYRGGINSVTQKQSEITTNSIIAIKGHRAKKADYTRTPKLENQTLFERDRHMCAYCGGLFGKDRLSREHINPRGQGGLDIWTNVVTACKSCNGDKGCRTLDQAGMKLLYLPYAPDRYENFILKQGKKKILADQMEFLLSKVNKKSRLRLN